MESTVLYKKVYERYTVQQHRDRSHLPSDRGQQYDGVHPFFDIVGVIKDEASFKQYLKDPLYTVIQDKLTLVVEENGDKISMKVFEKFFSRGVGKSYFKLKRNMKFITVNVKRGNIYFGELHNYQNKRKYVKTIRCNSFLDDSFRGFSSYLKNCVTHFDVDNGTNEIIEACQIFLNKIDGGINGISFGQRILKFYLDKKNIKYPNNFYLYSEVLTGDFKKILKKMDLKIVDTFMLVNKIQGKKVKKILHTATNLNVGNYHNGLKLFDPNWLNQDENLLREIFNNTITFDVPDNLAKDFVQMASPKEKRRAFSLYKTFNNLNEIDGWTLADHFRFYVGLKRYGDTEVEWKSDGSNPKKFREEHLDWTEKLSFYKKGEYQRVYAKTFLEGFKNIHVNDEIYFPVVLTNTKEYNEESSTQSNCVRGYIGSPSSLIISLRKGSKESDDRLTIEFRIHWLNNSQHIFLDRIQTRSKYNSTPDSSWREPLEILDEMVRKSNFQKYKLRKKCQNGVELESDTEFNENGYLEWTYKSIENDDNYFTIL